MDLLETQLSGQPLAVTLPNGTSRLLAELFLAKGGIVFADIGWCDPLCSFNPFHYLEGEISGENPWTIGGSVIYKVTSTDPLFPEWQQWLQAKAAMTISDRETAFESITHGGLDNVDLLK